MHVPRCPDDLTILDEALMIGHGLCPAEPQIIVHRWVLFHASFRPLALVVIPRHEDLVRLRAEVPCCPLYVECVLPCALAHHMRVGMPFLQALCQAIVIGAMAPYV